MCTKVYEQGESPVVYYRGEYNSNLRLVNEYASNLLRDFGKVDRDNDGFISKRECQQAAGTKPALPVLTLEANWYFSRNMDRFTRLADDYVYRGSRPVSHAPIHEDVNDKGLSKEDLHYLNLLTEPDPKLVRKAAWEAVTHDTDASSEYALSALLAGGLAAGGSFLGGVIGAAAGTALGGVLAHQYFQHKSESRSKQFSMVRKYLENRWV